MQSIWQSTKTWRESIRGWSISPALLVIGVGIACVATAAWYAQLKIADERVSLFGGRPIGSAQLGQMTQAFTKAKLDGYLVKNGQIYVSSGSTHQFLTALAEAKALPRDLHSFTGDAMLRGKFFESDRDRSSRILHAREMDLALAIREMDSIENAMVQYDETEERGFHTKRLMTASVAVLPVVGHVLDRQQIRTIKQIVANAKAGLETKDVCVTDLRSGSSYTGDVENEAYLPLAQEYLNVKRAIEAEWKNKVRDVISFVPEPRVVVNIDYPSDALSGERVNVEPRGIAIFVAVPETYGSQRQSEHLETSDGGRWQRIESQVREAVESLVPQNLNANATIAVTRYADPVALSRWNAENFWRDLWLRHQRAWMIVIAAGVLVAVIPWIRRRPSETSDVGTIPLRSLSDHRVDAASGAALSMNETELRTTLSELVREDPDVAADILHQWIDRAS